MDHDPHRLARAQEGSTRVDTEHSLPVVEARLQNVADMTDACVIDQEVEASHFRNLVERVAHLRFVGDIELQRLRGVVLRDEIARHT
jgi:hypothetical protein